MSQQLLNLLGSAPGGENLYVEDVFSTYTYTGNGDTQTISTGFAIGDSITVSGFSNDTNLEAIYTTPGTYSWTCPAGVTSVCVVCVGGGAGNAGGGSGAGGGGLGWKNNIPVTPGNSYTVVVGAGGITQYDSPLNKGGDSYFINTSTVFGGGGTGYYQGNPGPFGYYGGTFVGDGGGNGGQGAYSKGGGAGGYAGTGGRGRLNANLKSLYGQGGGGGVPTDWAQSGAGGGVGIYGMGISGTTGAGSVGNGAPTTAYGGGGAPDQSGQGGAVRIIWGAGRSFPFAAGYQSSRVEPVTALTWIKNRTTDTRNHVLTSFENGIPSYGLSTNATTESRWDLRPHGPVHNNTGLEVFHYSDDADGINVSNEKYSVWTFRKAPKFFDIVTYTGDGTNVRYINHNLGCAPGFVVVKCTSDGSANSVWAAVAKTSSGATNLLLNSTAAGDSDAFNYGYVHPGSITDSGYNATQFRVDRSLQGVTVNNTGQTYVAYLFAHDAGGFGTGGNESIISCGSYLGGSADLQDRTVNLGWEPQWVLVKAYDRINSYWTVIDNIRGTWTDNDTYPRFNAFHPNNSLKEQDNEFGMTFSSTGFTFKTGNHYVNGSNSNNYIYIAIRRPMKTPTTGTEVFGHRIRTGQSGFGDATPTITPNGNNLVTDMVMTRNRSGGVGGAAGQGAVGGFVTFDRLRGRYKALYTVSTNAEPSPGATGYTFDVMNGVKGVALTSGSFFDYDTNNSSYSYINYFFRRAPGFFDIVTYTGTYPSSTTQDVKHNLGVKPELVIVKRRNSSTNGNWFVWADGANSAGYLNLTDAFSGNSFSNDMESINTNATQFRASTNWDGNNSGYTYVAYLFASLPGVSKVGSLTIDSSGTLNVDCGFSNGARFVMLKGTSGTGSWLVFDTARGIVSDNDPYLALNSTSAENFYGANDNIDPYSPGFSIPMNTFSNLEGTGTYIYLAIA